MCCNNCQELYANVILLLLLLFGSAKPHPSQSLLASAAAPVSQIWHTLSAASGLSPIQTPSQKAPQTQQLLSLKDPPALTPSGFLHAYATS